MSKHDPSNAIIVRRLTDMETGKHFATAHIFSDGRITITLPNGSLIYSDDLEGLSLSILYMRAVP